MKNIIKKVHKNFSHNTVQNALKAGDSAFRIRVPFYNNPYKENPCKSAWIRGFMRSDKLFQEGIKRSMSIQDSLGFEEV